MPFTKQQKGEVIEKLKKIFSDSTSVVFVNFHGFSVSDSQKIRRSLKEKTLGFLVTKKTLLKKALESLNLSGQVPALDGEVAIAFGNDPVLPAKGIAEFAKENEGKLKILGGIFEAAFVDSSRMEELAKIPSRQELLGMLLNIINAPIQGLVIALNEITKSRK